MKFGYRKIFLGDTTAREQDLESVDQIFEDRITSSQSFRSELDDLMKFASQDDQIIVQSMDCLGKDVRDLYKIISALHDKGASVRFVNEDINFAPSKNNSQEESLITLLKSLANFEHMIIKRRQREGIYKAKKMKIRSILFTSEMFKTNKKIADITFKAPTKDIARTQEVHILIGHLICEALENLTK